MRKCRTPKGDYGGCLNRACGIASCWVVAGMLEEQDAKLDAVKNSHFPDLEYYKKVAEESTSVLELKTSNLIQECARHLGKLPD